MKKIVLAFMAAVFLSMSALPAYAQSCVGYRGMSSGITYKYVDQECDGTWDTILQLTLSNGLWVTNGFGRRCPRNERRMHLNGHLGRGYGHNKHKQPKHHNKHDGGRGHGHGPNYGHSPNHGPGDRPNNKPADHRPNDGKYNDGGGKHGGKHGGGKPSGDKHGGKQGGGKGH